VNGGPAERGGERAGERRRRRGRQPRRDVVQREERGRERVDQDRGLDDREERSGREQRKRRARRDDRGDGEADRSQDGGGVPELLPEGALGRLLDALDDRLDADGDVRPAPGEHDRREQPAAGPARRGRRRLVHQPLCLEREKPGRRAVDPGGEPFADDREHEQQQGDERDERVVGERGGRILDVLSVRRPAHGRREAERLGQPGHTGRTAAGMKHLYPPSPVLFGRSG